MPLFFESLLALLNGDLSFFVGAVAGNFLWFFLIAFAYWFLESEHSLFGFAWWTFGLLLFLDVLALTKVPSFMLTFPFFAAVLSVLIFNSVSEKWSLLAVFFVFGMLGAIFLI